LTSEPGQGSRFTVLLPAATDVGAEPESGRSEAELQGRGRVLVIDEEESVRLMAGRTLEAFGYSAMPAINGSHALEMLERDGCRPDLVLMDSGIPGTDGIETVTKLRALDPSIKVLVCSGYSQQEMVKSFGNLGVADFLQKPFTACQLALAVKRALDGVTLRD
jgi:DNA-binding NtrC family response regulator